MGARDVIEFGRVKRLESGFDVVETPVALIATVRGALEHEQPQQR
jgi:hypothetical protein